MPGKFAKLAADVAASYRAEIIDPRTNAPLRDRDGNVSYIDVLSTDSPKAREFEKGRRKDLRQRLLRSRTGTIDTPDQIDENCELLALLTVDWHLVGWDGEVIDLPCTVENATELYTEPGMASIFNAVWFAANNVANFLPPAPPRSSAMPSGSSPTSGA